VKYRPEIDGLRALAVVPVVFYHAGVPLFSGGFAGVDVFFVISGYLITSLLVEEQARGEFSIAAFYRRRARRILPALCVVVAACAPFAYAWLAPAERRAFAESVSAVAAFCSNIFFWRQSGYFDSASELKPLLHTWSLGVEEQFYLLFPVFLLCAGKLGMKRTELAVAILTLLSFLLSEWMSLSRPAAAFFLAPPRAWELLLGSLAALSHRHQRIATWTAARAQMGASTSLVLLCTSYFIFDRSSSWPGTNALMPTVAAAGVILFTSPTTWVGRLLSSPPLVGIGVLSYSIYLWHQPLFAFARQRLIDQPGMGFMALLCAATLILSYFTWKFVERPMRTSASGWRPLSYACVASALMFVAGAFSATAVKVESPGSMTNGECNYPIKNCFARPNPTFRVAMWGDSFADAFSIQLATELAKANASLYLFIKHSCPSIVGTLRNEPHRTGTEFAAQCAEHNSAALKSIRREKFDFVVLTSAYQDYIQNVNDSREPVLLDRDNVSAHPTEFVPIRLSDTIRSIRESGAQVVLLTPYPVLKDFLKARKELLFGVAQQEYANLEEATNTRALLLSHLQSTDFLEVDGRDLLCSGHRCPIVTSDGALLLYDGAHMSKELATEAARRIVDRIRRQHPRRP
jgi:peptidoglycan/LPS O-acetylase OafA/YrhL